MGRRKETSNPGAVRPFGVALGLGLERRRLPGRWLPTVLRLPLRATLVVVLEKKGDGKGDSAPKPPGGG